MKKQVLDEAIRQGKYHPTIKAPMPIHAFRNDRVEGLLKRYKRPMV